MFSLLRHTPLNVFLDSTVLLAACLVLTVRQVWSVLQPHKNQQDNASQVCSLIFFLEIIVHSIVLQGTLV